MDGDNLPPWEQSLLIQQMRAIYASDPPALPSRYDAARVIKDRESFTDE